MTTAVFAVGCVSMALPRVMSAQERLVASRTAGIGGSFETIRFAGAGLLQAAFAGVDTTRIRQVSQYTVPVAVSTPIGRGWRLDLTTLVATGRVTFNDPAASGGTRSVTLAGISDVRARATGRLLSDAVVFTVGANIPTGRTSLDANQFAALRVVSAPALGLGSSPVGAGPSGTMGLVIDQQAGKWAMAYGASYEARGKYQPVAALTAGTGSSDFVPGGVIRLSVGADRLVGAHRLSLAAAADVFQEDRLEGAAVPAGGPDSAGGTPVAGVSRVKLGPVLSGDAQLQIAAPRVRELLSYLSYRWRAPFARDGRTIERSSGQYVESGVRVVLPAGARRDLVLSTDARWHSGLGVDQGVPTAGVTSAAASVGLQFTRGMWSVQPYARAQVGALRQRGALVPVPSQRFTGVGTGLVMVSRF